MIQGATIRKVAWPYNLAMAIFSSTGKGEVKDILASKLIECVDTTLSEREAQTIHVYFEQKKTLKETGEILGVGYERARQIKEKAIRKLRHPTRATTYIAVPMSEYIAKQNEIDYLKSLIVKYEKALNEDADTQTVYSTAELFSKDISEMELSVRSYNCLRRRGITRIGHFQNLTLGQLITTRNLGGKSYVEVVRKLEDLGFMAQEDDHPDEYKSIISFGDGYDIYYSQKQADKVKIVYHPQ